MCHFHICHIPQLHVHGKEVRDEGVGGDGVGGEGVRDEGVRDEGVRDEGVKNISLKHHMKQDSRKKRLNPSLSTMIPRKGDATAESQYTRLWRNEGGGERGERGREEGGRRE